MLTFLFWNMGGESPKDMDPADARARTARLAEILHNLTKVHDVDLLMLSECPLLGLDVLRAINHDPDRLYREPDPKSLCDRIKIYPRFAPRWILRRDESGYFTGRRVSLPARDRFLLYVVHLSSKTNQGEESQSQEMPGFSTTIREREELEKHTRTIVVGDFNMNPFETGMVSAQGMNAVMSRDVAKNETRTLHGVTHPFFYNPMWGHFGDHTHDQHPPGSPDHDPAGTCYYSSGESKWFFWSMFDQVMVRPALLDRFRTAELKILVTDGMTSFLNRNGRPDRPKVSDHLPIRFRIDI